MIPDYEELEAALVRAGVDYSAAEPATSLGDSERMLESLFELTRRQLGGEPPLQLMLPDDEPALLARVAALSRWCEGFLFGMAIAGAGEQTILPDDIREICNDMVEISRAGVANQHTEEDESAYCEIVEYLCVGVLLINEELRPAAAGILVH